MFIRSAPDGSGSAMAIQLANRHVGVSRSAGVISPYYGRQIFWVTAPLAEGRFA